MDLQLGSWREGFFYARELDGLLRLGCVVELNHIRNLREAEDYLSGILFNMPQTEASEVVNNLGIKTNLFDDKYPLATHLKSKFSEKHQLPNDAYLLMEGNLTFCAFCYQFLYFNSSHIGDEIKDNEGKVLDPKHSRQPLIKTNTFPRLPTFLENRDLIRIPSIVKRTLTPNTISDLINCIKTAFNESEIDIIGQKYILDLLADAWKKTSRSEYCKKFNKWLNIEDTNQISWLQEYFIKKSPDRALPWEPTNINDYYYIQHAEFHYHYLIKFTSAKLFFQEARSAWNQRKFQNKNKGTKSRSISMSERTNKRLNWLAENKDQKINAVIKELIDLEFEHLGGPSKL
ncbi:hypothetical protein ST37_14060 [Vibrio sp. qd031]|uniref:hypothetical protein n=1 Tax=Vibrio sp. qd031 TaxID=1603038 RepID=UPI000A0F694F|nr:hypothetical protein [Vibrio sp. qd031]ORT49516.1 hypothetical protein ST37_14060 [Vibrio sp. qd031]